MKKSANFKGSWVKSKGVTPAFCLSLLQRHVQWMQGLNTGEHGTVLPTSQWHKGAIEPNFGWGRAPFWTVSPSLLCHLPANLSTAVKKLIKAESFHTHYIWVSSGVARASHLGLPCQNFWCGSLSILFNISLQGYVRKYFHDQGKKVCLFEEYYVF